MDRDTSFDEFATASELKLPHFQRIDR